MSVYWIHNPSGGLAYHWRAKLYSSTLWQPFISHVHHWTCEQWSPKTPELIVFGASAGYSISTEFLQCFKKIIIVDPDPWAPLFFQHKNISPIWIQTPNLLRPDHNKYDQLEQFLGQYSQAAILFSNILGQLNLFNSNLVSSSSQLMQVLHRCLNQRIWASYHDIVSSSEKPRQMMKQIERIKSLPDFVENLWSPSAKAIEVHDHGTWWLSGQGPMQLAQWQLQPQRFHVVGFIQHQ